MKPLRRATPSANVADTKTAIMELQALCSDLRQAIIELQEIQSSVVATDDDGFPSSGSELLSLNGRFLRLTQSGVAPTILKVSHGLGRIPIGAIFTNATGVNQILVNGDVTQNIAPATIDTVTFVLNGSSGDEHICLVI